MQTPTSAITFRNCPLTALSNQTLRKLSNFLNAKKLFHTDEGYERDWRGLATLAEQRSSLDENAISGDDPTAKIIKLWCENNPDTATFENLENILGIIDRWHIIDDIEENLLQDLRDYQITQQQQQQEIIDENTRNNNEDTSVSSNDNNTNNTFNIPTPPTTPNNENIKSAENHFVITHSMINNTLTNPPSPPPPPPPPAPPAPSTTLNDYVVTTSFTYGGDSNFLTCEDVRRAKQGLPLQHYDALVLYADADYEYAREILIKLQTNFKFCLKEHLLYGIQFEHDALMVLIRERCTFLIVILTNEFNKSPENRFFLSYAQFLQIQTARRKILPLRYDMNVEIPANLGMYTGMAYNPKRTQIFWDKLANSLECAKMSTRGELTYSTNAMTLPSAPLLLDEFKQPPYNPQYKLKYWDPRDFDTASMPYSTSPSSSISSSKDQNTPYGRKVSIPCEVSQSTQSNLYPNMLESFNSHPNVIKPSKEIATTSSASTSTNNTQSEEEGNPSTVHNKRKNNKGPSNFLKKLFKKP